MKMAAPLLPARSVNFNDLHNALVSGDSDEIAIAKACGDKPKVKTACEKPKSQKTKQFPA